MGNWGWVILGDGVGGRLTSVSAGERGNPGVRALVVCGAESIRAVSVAYTGK